MRTCANFVSSCCTVLRTVARARGGEGLTWGFTVIPLVGDTCRAMQPQVSLTSGRAHTRAAPGDAPGYHIYVCMWCFGTGSHACHGVKWAWAGRTTSALYPQSIDRGVVDAQCYHTSTTFAHEHVRCLPPHPHLGTCSHTWGYGRPGCSPTWGHSDSRCYPNVAPPPPVRGLPYGPHPSVGLSRQETIHCPRCSRANAWSGRCGCASTA